MEKRFIGIGPGELESWSMTDTDDVTYNEYLTLPFVDKIEDQSFKLKITKFLQVTSFKELTCINGTPTQPDEIYDFAEYFSTLEELNIPATEMDGPGEFVGIGMLFGIQDCPALVTVGEIGMAVIYVTSEIFERLKHRTQVIKLVGENIDVEL